jgi:colanic acid biosynthesis glycosyl transferase WcaI
MVTGPVVHSPPSLKMRFLLLNQFYPPDPAPTGLYLQDLAQVLVERGHEVKVLCSRRSYDGRHAYPKHVIEKGVEVYRLAATGFGRKGFVGKVCDYASFCMSLGAALLFDSRRPDLILSLTTPPYLGMFGKIAAKRHQCRHANWIMDLYPDVMFAHGMAEKSGLVYRVLERLTRFQLRGTQAVVALGPVMARCSARYLSDDSRVEWLPLWSDAGLAPWPDGETVPLRGERGWKPDELVLLYSGNMGLGHRFTEFLEAARRLGKVGPRWVFCGGGKRRAEIEEFAKANGDSRIELLDYAPRARVREHLSAADVHLMSMDEAWQGLMVPSKLQASFAVGRPVIYVGGRNCETASWIQESGGGWVIEQQDVKGLLEAIRCAQDPVERRQRGAAARDFAKQHFDKASLCTRFAEILENGQLSLSLVASGKTDSAPTNDGQIMPSRGVTQVS